MKRGVIVLSIIFLATAVFGQQASSPTEKGNMMFGGRASFQKTSGPMYESTTEITLAPFGGYFLKKNLVLGAELQFTSVSMEGFTSSYFAFGPWAAYMFKNFQPGQEVKGALIPFAKVGFMFRSFGNTGNNWETSTSGFMIPIGGGLVYMLSPTLGLVVDAYYSLDHTKFKDAEEGTSGNRIVISIGLSYFHHK